MRSTGKVIEQGALAALILSSLACGTSDSTGPSAMATIEGTVNPGTAAAGPDARALAAASNGATITVSVVGTGLSTTTDASGSFVITGVPSGSVTLRFQGSGIDATLQISGIEAGQTLTITVRVSGSSAVLDGPPGARQQCAASGAKAEIEGEITAATASSITVFQQGAVKGSYVCQVSSATRIRKGNTTFTLSQLQLGSRVHVSGTGLGSSSGACQVKAEEIKVQ